jgi:hypothetical protein
VPVVKEVESVQALEDEGSRKPGLLRTVHFGMHGIPEHSMQERSGHQEASGERINGQAYQSGQRYNQKLREETDGEIAQTAGPVFVVEGVVALGVMLYMVIVSGFQKRVPKEASNPAPVHEVAVNEIFEE